MKILHVVTFIDVKMSYGGPVAVARQLAKIQRKRNIVSDILALSNRSETLQEPDNAYREFLFQAKSIFGIKKFSALYSLRALVWIYRNAGNYDVVHLHFSRDLFQVSSAIILIVKRLPFVLQTHGMLTSTKKKRIVNLTYDKLIGWIVGKSSAQLALNSMEASALAGLGWFPRGQEVGNGIEFDSSSVWNNTSSRRVVFLSRLHARKNPLLFVEAAKMWIETGPKDVYFEIAGSDEGEGSKVQQEIEKFGSKRLSFRGGLSHKDSLELLSQASLLVLPSVNEPFPMVVLEALSHGTPVVVTDSCHISQVILENHLGEVSEANASKIVLAIGNSLSINAPKIEIKNRARKIFDINEIQKRIEEIYQTAIFRA